MNKASNSSQKKSDGRGRKKGAVSFMQVTLAELNRVLRPDARVIISLKYATLIGLQGKPVGADISVFENCVNSNKTDFSLETFSNEESVFFENDEQKQVDLEKNKEKTESNKNEDNLPPQLDLISWDE